MELAILRLTSYEPNEPATAGNSATPESHAVNADWVASHASDSALPRLSKIILIIGKDQIGPVSEIRLRRTDTTLDLSQKAEKV